MNLRNPKACQLLALIVGVVACSPIRAIAAKDFATLREQMVDHEIAGAGIKDPRVIKSMRDTPRHEFVDARHRPYAYYDMALPIGSAQTISPPFIVAYMTEQLLPQPTDKVLEIGTGSGYQAAVLSPLVKDVYTIEIVNQLGEKAARTLKRLKYANVHAKVGDGYQGWPDVAPFDKIIVTCSPENVPPKLVEQLREGGRMLVPVGERYQQTLYLFEKKNGKLNKVALLPMLFVPMTGKAEAGRQVQPDSLHPEIRNGGFEESTAQASESGSAPAEGESPAQSPFGWHYQRQLELVKAADAPEGSHYITLSNAEPGRGALALQGLAVDGRKIGSLNLSLWVKAQNIQPGVTEDQRPMLEITFYDENRDRAGRALLGPWSGSFDWRQVTEKVRVPPKAREAIVRIGLSGATGKISLDDVRIEAIKK